ncbi:MAG: hypothetical protein P4M15_06550 [Alphaproteobacteria bacterium]|nr:hypothetical protein [Alphaproteobacteria bacterium]
MPADEDDAAIYDMMRSIATDGDLFDHAVQEHEAAAGESGETVQAGDEDVKAAARNAKALKKGISKLEAEDEQKARGFPGSEGKALN